jgi:flagellar FliL protein
MSEAKPAEAAAPKKKGKLLLIIGIIVLVLAIGAAAAVFLLQKKSHDGDDEADEDAVLEQKPAKKSAKSGPPIFVKLEAFTVRLQTEGTDSYLQAVPELRVLDNQIAEEVKLYMPEIRHKALLVIAAKQPTDVNNPLGVQKLSNELRVTINSILSPSRSKRKKPEEAEEISDTAEPGDPVQAVLFTSFIVQ